MTNAVRQLTPAEISEANKLGKEVGRCRGALDTAREQVEVAVTAGVPQDSERWDQLCDQLDAKLKAEAKAADAERGWWQSKGFNV